MGILFFWLFNHIFIFPTTYIYTKFSKIASPKKRIREREIQPPLLRIEDVLWTHHCQEKKSEKNTVVAFEQ